MYAKNTNVGFLNECKAVIKKTHIFLCIKALRKYFRKIPTVLNTRNDSIRKEHANKKMFK